MQFRQFLAALTLLSCAALAPIGSARADTVLFDNAGFIRGSQSFVDSFNISTPGTLTISFAGVSWLDALSNVNLFVTSASGPIGFSMGDGTESMRVGTGTFYAHWFGQANGQYQIGVYSLKIMFHPDVSAVPLPGSLILLLSGLTLLFFHWQRRRQAAVFGAARIR